MEEPRDIRVEVPTKTAEDIQKLVDEHNAKVSSPSQKITWARYAGILLVLGTNVMLYDQGNEKLKEALRETSGT